MLFAKREERRGAAGGAGRGKVSRRKERCLRFEDDGFPFRVRTERGHG